MSNSEDPSARSDLSSGRVETAEDLPTADDQAGEILEGTAVRIRRVGRISTEQHWEIIRAELLQLMAQGYTAVEIARECDVSPDTAYRWKRRLVDDLRREASTMQPRDFIMESISSLRLARAEAWKSYHACKSEKDKRAYLQVVIQAEKQCANLGVNVGMFGGRDDKPLAPGSYGESMGDPSADAVASLREMMFKFLSDAVVKQHSTVASSEPETDEDILADLKPTDGADCEEKSADEENESPAPLVIRARKRRRPRPPAN